MKKCLTCRHWAKDVRVGGPEDLYRECKGTPFEDISWVDPDVPRKNAPTAYTVDGSGYWAASNIVDFTIKIVDFL